VTSERSMCSGADSDSKSEYQDIPGGKGGWCVRLTTYLIHVPIYKKYGALKRLEACGPAQACNGTDSLLPLLGTPKDVLSKARKWASASIGALISGNMEGRFFLSAFLFRENFMQFSREMQNVL